MDYRQLGHSGLWVSALTLGTMTFGGRGHWTRVGATEVDTATRQVDMCLDAGVNLIDTADVYSEGLSEEVVGKTLKGRRDRVLIATKARFAMGDGPNDAGLSRHHLISDGPLNPVGESTIGSLWGVLVRVSSLRESLVLA